MHIPNDISQEEAINRFSYDKETGKLFWKDCKFKSKLWNANFPGKEAGSISSNGYVRIKLEGKNYRAHRIIWVYKFGDIPHGMAIDHINRNGADNRIDNLRLVTVNLNMANCRSKSKSGLKTGMTKKTNGYAVRIRHHGIRHYIGTFKTEEEAHNEYCKAFKKLHGCEYI